MTRDEFIKRWLRDDYSTIPWPHAVADLDALLEATRQEEHAEIDAYIEKKKEWLNLNERGVLFDLQLQRELMRRTRK